MTNCMGVIVLFALLTAHAPHVPSLQILELLKRNDFHYKEGDTLAFPPAPKWRPEHRDKM